MNFPLLFSLSSLAALLGWLWLALAPRFGVFLAVVQYALIGAFAVVYASLMFAFFFTVPGGGFGSIGEVRALFLSDPALLAGWIHYLAFDLFVGLYIARESDLLGVPRIIQAFLLLATFLFGPIGLLLFYSLRATARVEAAVFGPVAK